MANHTNATFMKHDDYMTPKHAWEEIKQYIPRDKIIWEAFYGDGESGKYLKELGFDTIHEPVDFFQNNLGEIVVSNPPFSLTASILERLKELDKPFILILPSSKINTQYFRSLFRNKGIQIIIPTKRIQFCKIEKDGEKTKKKSACNFDCFYYCWKMDLPSDIVWL